MLETGRDTPTTSPNPATATDPAPEPENRPRRIVPGVTLAAGLLVVVLVGVLALGARGAVSDVLLAQPTPTATTAARAPTPLPSATAVPVGPVATLPPATIATGVYWSGGGGVISQDCQGTQTLGASAFTVDNSHSTVAVDWWVNIANATPDGKQLWSSVNKPYGTLPPGQSVTVTVWPNPVLCGQLAGHPTPEVYHLIVSYGGVGGADLQDSIKPPSATPPGNQ
ncbi:MAG TPA: hypothetical protein VGR57_00670 [Ktedonobacterales bacterium]|nr:hypothetical protein [Ktedonobacterales bacterium]